MIIYKITNILNNKIYIGQTIQSIKRRWYAHNDLRNNSYIACSIRKYGKENFTIEQIDSAKTLEELNEKEIYWINFFNTIDKQFGYNIAYGGKNSIHSEETRKKLSINSKGRKASEETKKKMSIIHSGMKHSEESKKKMSESKKGKGSNLGKKLSEETKKRISIKLIEYRKTSLNRKGIRTTSTAIIAINKQGNEFKFNAVVDAAKELNIGRGSITSVLTGRSKTAGGFIFKYDNKKEVQIDS